MNMKILLVLLDKEFRQFFRNSFLPKLVLLFPLTIMLVMPWVTTMDVRHINVAVVDQDHTPASRRLAQKIGASDYFTLVGITERYDESFEHLEAGDADVIVEIPQRFEESLVEAAPEKLRITSNGVNAMKGGLGAQYITGTVVQTLTELRSERGLPVPEETVTVQNRYNPTLEYRHYMIPALMIMLLILMCGFLPALNLVSEKEIGTIEQINVTPVGRFTFTLAKLIPCWLIGFTVLTVAILLARLVYGLAPEGSLGAIYLAAGLFILAMSGLGITIANGSSTMQQVMFVMFFFIMIFVLMSGLITPIASMPAWAQAITYLLPPRYFITIMQSVYLKGSAVAELWPHYTALCVFAAALGLLAAATYKKQA